MNKLITLLITMMLVLSLAACGGNEAPVDTTAPGTSQQQPSDAPDDSTPSGGEQTQEEKTAAAFAQFGLDVESIKADLDGEVSTYAVVKDPLDYGANAQWGVKPAAEATDEQTAAYREQVYNAIKAVSDDGEVHGSKTNGKFEAGLSLEEAADEWTWGYLYNGSYVDVYYEAFGGELSLELVYAGKQ